MSSVLKSTRERWDDLLEALEFAKQRFINWANRKLISAWQLQQLTDSYARRKAHWSAQASSGAEPPATGLPAPVVGESANAKLLRYWCFLHEEIHRLTRRNLFTLSQQHTLQDEVRQHRMALARRLNPGEEIADALPVEEDDEESAAQPRVERKPPPLPVPKRTFLEILLDPHNIQYLLIIGGLLMVVGLVILLWVNNVFEDPYVAASALGGANLAAMLSGWYLVLNTRYQTAGRALTLLACLVMPLNLWYYHENDLLTVEGHLWVAGVVMSLFYLASALVLRDELFVYVQSGGVTLAALLILASWPPSPEFFWQIAAPSSLLVGLGLLSIHIERAFLPEGEEPFTRRRFGLAYFWSGHAQLAGGLLLLLGAFVAGSWLYQPIFRPLFEANQATPSPMVGELRWLSLLLVLAGTYAYVYSDLVVRKVGYYVHLAAVLMLWALIILLEILQLELGIDTLIIALSVGGLLLNLLQTMLAKDSPYTRSFPVLGVALPLLAVFLGGMIYLRAVSTNLRGVWATESLTWTYILGMAITAITCRIGAYLYGERKPGLAAVYFFATGAATLTGAAALLAVLNLGDWEQHAPILMLIPIVYLVTSYWYGSESPTSRPLLWVGHAATVVMLIGSLASVVEGFTTLKERSLINLSVALFFAEVACFYGLAAWLHRQAFGVHLMATAATASAWQLMVYFGVGVEIYLLVFAVLGLIGLLVYRFSVVEKVGTPQLADATFQSGNCLLSLSLIATAFLAPSRFLPSAPPWSYVGLTACLSLLSLIAVYLTRHPGWRRWYVVASVGGGMLAGFGVIVHLLTTLSPLQKLEVVSVVAGLALLIAGHFGWYQEQDKESDLVSISLFLGSLLVTIPLAIASLVDRASDRFLWPNELGFFLASIVLLTTGILFQLRATTIIGALSTLLYFVTLLLFVPWSRLNTLAIFIIVGGGTLFGLGLLLSLYRERLLSLPERVKRREGIFRVLNWR